MTPRADRASRHRDAIGILLARALTPYPPPLHFSRSHAEPGAGPRPLLPEARHNLELLKPDAGAAPAAEMGGGARLPHGTPVKHRGTRGLVANEEPARAPIGQPSRSSPRARSEVSSRDSKISRSRRPEGGSRL